MPKRTDKKSDLVAAASELDAELARFEDAVGGFKKLSLTSKKSLERAAKVLAELAEAEQAVGARIQSLVQAIGATGERQLAQVADVRAKAEELNARNTAFRELMAQVESLGTSAGALNDKLSAVGTTGVDLDAELAALGSRAEELFGIAKEKDFDDVAHLVDSLKQQIVAVRTKLGQTPLGERS